MTPLAGRHVFLSASFPSGERGKEVEPYDPQAIADAVSAVVRAVFVEGGKLLFGGHPTITPLILFIGTELRAKRVVDVFQSKWFSDGITEETTRLVELGVGKIHWTPREASLEDSLCRMRESMFSYSKPVGAIFVGGMSGIRDEYKEFGELCPGVPRIPLSGPGGAASHLEIDKNELPEDLMAHLQSRRYPFVASAIVHTLEKMILAQEN